MNFVGFNFLAAVIVPFFLLSSLILALSVQNVDELIELSLFTYTNPDNDSEIELIKMLFQYRDQMYFARNYYASKLAGYIENKGYRYIAEKLTRNEIFDSCKENMKFSDFWNQFLYYLILIDDESMNVEILDGLAALLYYSRLYEQMVKQMERPRGENEPNWVPKDYGYIRKWLNHSGSAMKARLKQIKGKIEAKLNTDKTHLKGGLLKTNEELLQKLEGWNGLIFGRN